MSYGNNSFYLSSNYQFAFVAYINYVFDVLVRPLILSYLSTTTLRTFLYLKLYEVFLFAVLPHISNLVTRIIRFTTSIMSPDSLHRSSYSILLAIIRYLLRSAPTSFHSPFTHISLARKLHPLFNESSFMCIVHISFFILTSTIHFTLLSPFLLELCLYIFLLFIYILSLYSFFYRGV